MAKFSQYDETPETRVSGQSYEKDQTDVNGYGLTSMMSLLDQFDVTTSRPFKASYFYQAAAAANVVVSATPATLVGMIIGADVGSAVIEVSDHASDGDGNVQVYLAGSTLLTSCGGYVPVNAYFATGITADLTNQTQVTFIYIPD